MAEIHDLYGLTLPKRIGESVTQGHWSLTLLFGNGPMAASDCRAFADKLREAKEVEVECDTAATFLETRLLRDL